MFKRMGKAVAAEIRPEVEKATREGLNEAIARHVDIQQAVIAWLVAITDQLAQDENVRRALAEIAQYHCRTNPDPDLGERAAAIVRRFILRDLANEQTQ